MMMIWRLFKQSTQVKPFKAYPLSVPESEMQWVVWQGRYITSLWDDLRRYGLGVFWHNFWFVILNRKGEPS